MRRLIFGKKKTESIKVPLFISNQGLIYISTRAGNSIIDWGDGSSEVWVNIKSQDPTISVTSSNVKTHNYELPYTGDLVVFLNGGIKDIYSVYLTDYGIGVKYNIIDIAEFLSQFTNIYSLRLNFWSEIQIVKGRFFDIPDSLERYIIDRSNFANAPTDVIFNFNDFSPTSNLKYFYQNYVTTGSNTPKLTGNLANLPKNCSYFVMNNVVYDNVVYQGSKIWANSFDTIKFNGILPPESIDSILIDMSNSITSATGGKLISFPSCWRTKNSNAAFDYLKSLGFTIVLYGITSNVPAKMLDIDFQNNFVDKSGYNTMIASTGTLTYVAGRKGTDFAAKFQGTQAIKTQQNVFFNSNKASVAFWIKTTATTRQIIFELAINGIYWNNSNGFEINLNSNLANGLSVLDAQTSNNKNDMSVSNINTGVWKHIVVTIDRSLGINQNEIWVNGVSAGIQDVNKFDNSINYGSNNPVYIGQRNGGLNAEIQELSAYNYKLSPAEILTLYNS